ncbi:MAG: hypothetical protein IKP00_01855 [Victivallales bacterium]|nr:hypothetical protein [Victivallales bacterium]
MEEDTEHKLPPWTLPTVFVVLLLLLYLLPHKPTEAMEIHQAITEALRAGNNWGRQALVGNTDYPALQSLCLLVCEAVATPIRLSGPRLMCALTQAWMLTIFVRILLHTGHLKLAWLPILLSAVLPVIRDVLLSLDPNWIAAVPAAEILYHLVLWKETKNLRSMIVASACCGILCLCGLAGLFTGCATAILLYIIAKKDLAEQGSPTSGLRTLLWSTAAYSIFIWLLWNWLVMDDVFFGLRDLFARLPSISRKGFNLILITPNPLSVIILLFLAPLVILCLKSDKKEASQCLIVQVVLLLAVAALSRCIQIPATAVWPLVIVDILSTVTLASICTLPHKVSRETTLASLIIIILASFRIASSFTHGSIVALAPGGLPPREELTAFIDQFWPQSRTMLYGLKLPAAYPDPLEKRFVARLDFQQDDLLKQETDEQLHILIPPPNGKYYPKDNSPLADIYVNGRDWLILEKQWPSGCQLWRVVPPPQNESKLKFLQ